MSDTQTNLDPSKHTATGHVTSQERHSPMPTLYRKFGKRAFDLVATLSVSVFVVPVICILAAIVMFDGANPFYSQLRIGKNGKVFRMWKLRTMVPNADIKLAAYLANNPSAQSEWDEMQKLANDPRITRFGRWLRRSSMDELPQLFNVFLGSMSLVGPRPIMVQQRESYPGESYYKMLPGMTGPWQVSERSESAFVARVGHDNGYYQQMSFASDLSLIVRTISVVFKGTGQ